MSRSSAAAKLVEAAPVFAALGDRTRVGIVARLCLDGPSSTTHLSRGARVTRQAITKHLNALGEVGIVKDSWRGRERIWELEPRRLEKARRVLDQVSRDWDAAIDRLRAFVEDGGPRSEDQRHSRRMSGLIR
jgi:DNA-binding transcriptional ArsR family regulator